MDCNFVRRLNIYMIMVEFEKCLIFVVWKRFEMYLEIFKVGKLL